MKLNKMAFAYAHGVAGAGFYIACWLLARFSQATLVGIANTWFHSLDLTSLPMVRLSLGQAILGLTTWVIFVMAWGYLVAWAYNLSVKK